MLELMNWNGVDVIDSRVVAEAVGKEHKKLLRDIRVYIEHLNEAKSGPVENSPSQSQNLTEAKSGLSENSSLQNQNLGQLNFEPSEFFIDSEYKDSTGRTLPRYLITKKGCEMIANKMTGAKGTQFTAAYVTVFNDMEKKQTEQEMFALPRNYKEALQQLIVQVDKNEELQRQNTALIHRIDQLEEKLELPAPKQEQKLYTASEIAAEYGMEAGELNLLLYSLHILKKEKGRWRINQRYQDKEYAKKYWRHVRWTESGRKFIHKKLKEKGYTLI